VREALGPDAVILSNNRVDGGIEIIAAVDYDESLLKTEVSGADLLANKAPSYSSSAADAHGDSLAQDTLSLSRDALPDLDFSSRREEAESQVEIPASPQSHNSTNPTSRNTNKAAAKENTATAKAAAQKIEWVPDPALTELKNEMQDIRDLLEQQLSSLAWADLNRRNPLQAKLTRCLLELGLSPSVCKQIAEAVGEHEDFDKVWRHALAILAHSLPVDSTDILDQGGIVALVGATGVGKTTTVAKLAARYALRHGSERIAMVTTDSYRIAAHEQLRTYGRILDIPVRIANTHEELVEALQFLADKDLVLIDTAGMSQRDMRLSQQFQLIKDSAPGIRTYLVLSSNTHRAGLREVAKAFGEVKLDGCILTKLDETTSLGGALSAVVENKLPVVYVSDGQRVPEDIHIARGHSLIARAVHIAQETNQALQQESLNLAFSGMVANAHG
jgi:flagellar biosynthesis protein FlhF